MPIEKAFKIFYDFSFINRILWYRINTLMIIFNSDKNLFRFMHYVTFVTDFFLGLFYVELI